MQLDGYKKTLLSSREFLEINKKNFLTSLTQRTDPSRKYRINKYGFRGEDFSPNKKILAAGCSFTFGVGVDEKSIWASILSKKLGVSNIDLIAKPGVSIPWIIENIFKYFKNYGHPEYLFCLFPNYERQYLPIDNLFYADKDYELYGKSVEHVEGTMGEDGKFFRLLAISQESQEGGNRYLKLPYDYLKVFSQDFCIKESTLSIKYLEDYCEAVGIKFLWSSWTTSVYEDALTENKNLAIKNSFPVFDLYANNFSTYTKVLKDYRKDVFFENSQIRNDCANFHRNVECSCYLKCHEDLRESSNDFDLGTDTALGLNRAHPGRHWHIHCADSYMMEIVSRGWTNNVI